MSEQAKLSTADSGGSLKREKIVGLINSVIRKVEGAHPGVPSKESIFSELKDLKNIIEETRHDIGMGHATDIKSKDLPVATDELDAVVEATADASGKIMDSCDVIQAKAEEMGGDGGNVIVAEVTKIYEACSFQDITGQRIKKVIKTLQSIEERVEKLLSSLGDQASASSSSSGDTRTGDAALLNGPQLPGGGVTQEDIDKLLAEFD